jgi:hypothetical protein
MSPPETRRLMSDSAGQVSLGPTKYNTSVVVEAWAVRGENHVTAPTTPATRTVNDNVQQSTFVIGFSL